VPRRAAGSVRQAASHPGAPHGFHRFTVLLCDRPFSLDQGRVGATSHLPLAISRQIAKLEHELRTPIFDRRAHGMTLTAAGEILRSEVEGITRELARAKSHIAGLQGLQAGTVDVYCYNQATESLIGPVVHELHSRHPNISFNFIVSSTDEAIAALIRGIAEIGLVINPPDRDALLIAEIQRDTIVAAVAPDHPLARRNSASLAELTEFPMASTLFSSGLRHLLDKVFNRCKINPNVFCVTNSVSLIKEIVSLGHGFTLLPRSHIEKALAVVAVPEFAEDPLIYCIAVLKRRSLSPAAKVFLDAAVAFCGRRPRPAVGSSR
jgi:DNA-binding transcriptional LysR family regulator